MKLQFGIRSLIVLMVVFACLAWWWQSEVRRRAHQRQVAIELLGKIDDAPLWNPTAVAVAVNHLIELPREDAIGAINEYVQAHPDEETLGLLLPLLAQPGSDLSRLFPNPPRFVLGHGMMEEGGLLFTGLRLFQGLPSETNRYIDPSEFPEFRINKIVVSDQPLDAVDEVVSRYCQQHPGGEEIAHGLYYQVYRCMRHLVSENANPALTNSADEFRKELNKRDIYWDETTSRYEARN